MRRTCRRFQNGPTLNQALSEIRRDILALDVEADLTLWRIESRVRRRPIQTGDHKMIIVPEQKLPVQLAIMNLHQPDTGRAGEGLEFICVLSGHRPRRFRITDDSLYRSFRGCHHWNDRASLSLS
jgi:hypothetical protein